MKIWHQVAYLLLWVGGVNWGLIGLFDYNLVESMIPGLSGIVYILVGVSAVYLLLTHKNYCKECMGKK